MTRLADLSVLLPLLLTVGAALGQSASGTKATGSVEGHVICDDGGVPGRAASVRLVPLASLLTNDSKSTGSENTAETTADFSGYYVFPFVPAGTYIVDARKDGYSSGGSYDFELLLKVLSRFPVDQQKKLIAAFPQVTVAAGTILREDVGVHRAGAISGRLTVDGGGVPGNTTITATLVSSKLTQGLDTKAGQSIVYSQSSMVDDRGVYRIAGLPAGKYRISARISEVFFSPIPLANGGGTLTSPRTGTASLIVYAPEALGAGDARLVLTGDGDEISGADVNIPLRLLHSISGIITAGGVAMPGVAISAHGEHSDPEGSDAMSTLEGSYRFDLLPAGTYTIAATVYDNSKSQPEPAVVRKITVQLGDNDLTDANLEMLPAQGK